MLRKVDPYADAGFKPVTAYTLTAVRIRAGVVVTHTTCAIVQADVAPTYEQIIALSSINAPTDIARDLDRYGAQQYVAADRTVVYFLVPNTRSEECRIELRKVGASVFQPLPAVDYDQPPFQPADAALLEDFHARESDCLGGEPEVNFDDI